jgi:hypothetical protein
MANRLHGMRMSTYKSAATATEKTFVYDLWLTRAASAWIERGTMERVAVERNGLVRRFAPTWGHPGRPVVSEGDAVWTEFLEGEGRAVYVEDGSARLIEPLRGVNVGDLALSGGTLLVECADSLRFLTRTRDGWDQNQIVWQGNRSYRPCLAGNLAAWDTYIDGRYRIAVTRIGEDPALLPCPEGHWESLPALAVAGNRRCFAARCRERLVDLPGGAVNHHSELVVAVQDSAVWRDVACIDIDYSLNPWMAAYWGLRRFPRLVADSDSVFLMWEEKLDPAAMDPGLGRLCGIAVSADGVVGEPSILMDERCMIVIESESSAPIVRAASKTQWHSFDWYVAYEHTAIDVSAQHPARPAPDPTHASLPASRVGAGSRKPRVVWPGTQLRAFYGDPHIHSRLSYDLDGEPDEIYHMGRDIGGLDFIALTENDGTRFTEPLTPADWERSRRMANLFNDPGRFTAFVAWEYTLHKSPRHPLSTDSHRSVIFPGDMARICSWVDDAAPTPSHLVESLRNEDVLLHYHHPGGLDITSDTLERNIEVCSGWWNCMRIPAFVENLHSRLDSGLQVGFIGGSDNHERNPGLGGAITGVWAAENTREAIYAAFHARRVFATTGLRPEMRFSIGEILMGSEGNTDATPELSIHVSCDVPVEAVEVVRDGTIVQVWRGKTTDLTYSWRDHNCRHGRHWYYVHVRFQAPPGQIDWSLPMPMQWNVKPACGIDAWTSPIYITKE